MSNSWQDEEKLRDAYIKLGEQKKVAEKFGCSRATIGNWMNKFDIPVRKKHPSHPFYHAEKLRSLYLECGSVERVRKRLECSPNHLKKWMDYHEIERDHKHEHRGKKVEISCDYCGKVEQVYKSTLNPDQNWYCSNSCMGKFFSENYLGDEHHSWRGGSQDYGSDWTAQRNKVRERDRNVCQKCGSNNSKRLPDVHHIEPVRSFENPNDAHKLDNLIQLCRSCHHRIEKYNPEKQREILNLN